MMAWVFEAALYALAAHASLKSNQPDLENFAACLGLSDSIESEIEALEDIRSYCAPERHLEIVGLICRLRRMLSDLNEFLLCLHQPEHQV